MQINYEEITELVLSVKDIVFNPAAAGHITEKGQADYVTEVDFSVQKYMVEQLRLRCPDIQFLGEEGEKSQVDWSRPVWILDPIDGTTNLIHDFQHSAVSLGLWNGEFIEFGCVYNPFRGEVYRAVRGQGATLNGQPIHVSGKPELKHSLVIVGTAPWNKANADKTFEKAKRIFMACDDIRRTGSAALDCCYVACGRAEGFFEYNLKPWDYAAGSIIVEEAGGCMTDAKGGHFLPDHAEDLLVTNGRIHKELLACVSD